MSQSCYGVLTNSLVQCSKNFTTPDPSVTKPANRIKWLLLGLLKQIDVFYKTVSVIFVTLQLDTVQF